MIELNFLNKYYNKGKSNQIHVIDNVSLKLPQKGMVALFGRSGCGKTTLLNVMGGLDTCDSGSVTVDGADISKNPDFIRNKYIGYVFQNYNLNNSQSCFDNVADALRLCGMKNGEDLRSRVRAALKNVGMEKFEKRTPDTLSGGQQQRIAIARAIVKNPQIILADEPTGNLDETNTVMIMDLLKTISKEQLVVLVTHEAELVDYYCDKVIELYDGSVVSIRDNEKADGYSARDKNSVYLGELEKTEFHNNAVNVEYYGDMPNNPINVRVVNNGGKLYLQINTPGVSLIDGKSETKLLEGVYEHKAEKQYVSSNVDMTALPKFEGQHYGKLFTFASAVKSGYKANFSQNEKKKRGKLFRRCMSLFACITVLITAVFGVSLADLSEIDDTYNHNVFYVYTPDSEVSDKLNNAVNAPDTGIDYIKVSRYYIDGDDYASFSVNFFETFNGGYDYERLNSNAVYLGFPLADTLELACGKKDNLENGDTLITTAVADKLLKTSGVGYISEYEDLIGLTLSSGGYSQARVAGIVKSSESSVYMSEKTLASEAVDYRIICADDVEINLENGKTVLFANNDKTDKKVGDTVILNGKEFEIAEIKINDQYESEFEEDVIWQEEYDETVSYYADEPSYAVNEYEYIQMSKHVGKNDFDDDEYYGTMPYTVIHSSNPELTEEWLENEFSSLNTGNKWYKALITPSSIREEKAREAYVSVIGQLIAFAVLLTLMSVCVYFIMRSSIMGRIKEIGIYRAIGVSSKNLLFRYFVESLTLTTLAAFVSFLLSSAFVWVCLSMSSYVSFIFFYPAWLALLLLLLIYAVCTFFGVLPVITLLKKTPSRILSKYDI